VDPDLELLQNWRDGDKTAGGRLLAKYFRALRSYFQTRVPELDQEDLIQEVFTRMVSARDRFEGRSSVRIYLFCIAKNVYYEALRKRYRPTGVFDELTESVADVSGRTQSSILAATEELRLLLDALRTLPAQQQELLELRYFQTMTQDEIAEVLGIPAGTVKSRIHAAHRSLRKRYGELLGGAVSQEQVQRALGAVRDAVERCEAR
jgi:RNA polymerase sigma-70 factor (ECF subfamily)